jgi:hypothetical protein
LSFSLISDKIILIVFLLLDIPKNVINQHEFCRIHYGELKIIPYGIQQGYPLQINFDNLPQRITNLRMQLMQIINGKINSQYLEMVINRVKEIGRAKASVTLMNYFELIQVSKVFYKFYSHLINY